jgi:hypothetical protein
MSLIKPPQFWNNVPDGSTLRAKSEGTNENYTIDMTVDSSGDDDSVVSQPRLEDGASIPLASPNRYIMTVRINFAGLPVPSVTFSAHIITPNGTQHQNPYTFTVSNPAGAPYRALMIAVTSD